MAEWYTRTTQGGFISSGEVQSCAIVDSHIRLGAVTSARASANLRARSVTGAIPAATTCAGIGSTGFVLWKPAVNVSLESVYLVPLTPWCSSSTAQVSVQVWSCASGVVGTVNTSSTVHAAGIFMPVTIAAATMVANESLMAWSNASSCQFAPPAFSIIVNYETTG